MHIKPGQRICTCVSHGCNTRRTRNLSGKVVPGYPVSRNELRTHQEQDQLELLSTPAPSFTCSEEPYSWLSLHPQPHFGGGGFVQGSTSHSSASSSAATTLTVAYLEEVRVYVSGHMTIWRSELAVTPFDLAPILTPPFPHLEDLQWLSATRALLLSGVAESGAAESLRTHVLFLVNGELAFLSERKAQWDSLLRRADPSHPRQAVEEPRFFTWPIPAVVACTLFLLALQLFFGLSRPCIAFIWRFLKLLVLHLTAGHGPRADETVRLYEAFSGLPNDPRAIIRRANMGASVLVYASCPKCCHLAAPEQLVGSGTLKYPEKCARKFHKWRREYTCNTPLLKSVEHRVAGELKHTAQIPIKPFAYASVADCIANYLSNRDTERALDNSAKHLNEMLEQPFDPSRVMHDISDGHVFSNFLGPDEQRRYFRSTPDELKLAFSLSVDWFHPRGATKRSTASLGLISLACLNLPPEIRYSSENLLVIGILPGPKESNVQPFLKPLVSELLGFWETGVRFSQTALRPNGRLVHAVLLPVVCDMQAGRKVAGFSGPTAINGCPYCKCQKTRYNDLSIINGSFIRRTWLEWKLSATTWRDFRTVKARKAHKKDTGIAWSELLRLPYWDPTQFFVVDGMHNLFLGLVQHHVREVWEIDEAAKKIPASATAKVRSRGRKKVRLPEALKPKMTVASIKSAERLLAAEGDEERWRKLETNHAHAVVAHLCRIRNLNVDSQADIPTRKEYVAALRAHAEQCRSRRVVPSNGQATVTHPHSAVGPRAGPSAAGTPTAPAPAPAASEQSQPPTLPPNAVPVPSTDALGTFTGIPAPTAPPTSLSSASAAPRPPEGLALGQDQPRVAAQPSTPPPTTRPAPNPYKMLRSDVERVRGILAEISTPFWLGRVAKDFGSASHGTPKADEWRTAATVQLPIALTLLWFGTDRHDDLQWFLDLATAVHLGTSRSTSASKARDYETHIRRYLTGMVERGFNQLPNHHAALHFADFLPAFGPVRGWWCFPVERQIGLLQKIKTNNQFGEMEKSLMDRAHRASHLHALASSYRPSLPQVVRQTLDVLKGATRNPVQGSLFADTAESRQDAFVPRLKDRKLKLLLASEYTQLKDTLVARGYHGIVSRRAKPLRHLELGGVRYSVNWASFDNSNIIFRRPMGKTGAGQICNIFVHERRQGSAHISETFVVVRRFIRATVAEQAPFGGLHHSFGAQLCFNALRGENDVDVLRPEDVMHHFASYAYEEKDGYERLVVWPLDRVRRRG